MTNQTGKLEYQSDKKYCDFREFIGQGVIGGDSGLVLCGTLWCNLAVSRCEQPYTSVFDCPVAVAKIPEQIASGQIAVEPSQYRIPLEDSKYTSDGEGNVVIERGWNPSNLLTKRVMPRNDRQ